jgi:hypothetical protein
MTVELFTQLEGGYGVEATLSRKSGRPKMNWQRTLREEALAAWKTWGEFKQLS